MRIDVRPWSRAFATLVALGVGGCSMHDATHASSAAESGSPDPSAADPSSDPTPLPASSSPSASSPPAPLPPAQGATLALKSALWSLDRGGVDAALTTDGQLAVFATGDLFAVDGTGNVVSDEAIDPTVDAKVAAFASLSLVGSALAGDAVRAGAVAYVDATHTVLVALPNCLTSEGWDVPVGGSVVRIAPSGDVYVAGIDASLQRTLTKLAAADGSVMWTVAFDDLAADLNLRIHASALDAMDVDAVGNVYVAGYDDHGDVRSGGPFTWTSLVAKVDANGAIAWRRDRDFEKARAVAVDPNGDVTVAARSQSEGTSNDLDVEQYAANGTLRWAWAPPIQGELARRLTGDPVLAVGADGAPFIAASVDEAGQGAQPTLIFALGADGAPRWYAYASGAAHAIAVNASSQVYVVRDVGISAYDGR